MNSKETKINSAGMTLSEAMRTVSEIESKYAFTDISYRRIKGLVEFIDISIKIKINHKNL